MPISAKTVEDYINSLSDERREAMNQLRHVISKNLPKGFSEVLNYGMPSWVVPHSLYKPGYHCDPKLPLPFLGIASQKNFIAVYHMGIYMNPDLLQWFQSEYPKHCKAKLDMGKSCIRFKKMNDIPYKLIGELSTKISPEKWIELYEAVLSKTQKNKK